MCKSAVPKRGHSKRSQTQKHANERKRVQKGAKERKNCKRPGVKQPGLGTPKQKLRERNSGEKLRRHGQKTRRKFGDFFFRISFFNFQEKCFQRKTLGAGGPTIFHAQYDWTAGVPDNGNEWRKFRVVPCFVLCEKRGGKRRLLDYQGRAGIISIVRLNLRPVIFDFAI